MSGNEAENLAASRQFKVGGEIFLMKSVLGRGTFGTVFLATRDSSSVHHSHDRDVAIKEIARSTMPKEFPAEAAILKQLQHPNIVHLYNVDDSYSDYIYLVLEYCEGGDLKTVLQKHRRLPDYLCRRLFQDLTSGLQFLYERRLIHRDIKPQNLLLSEPIVLEHFETDSVPAARCTKSSSVTLKIADFGSARYLQESSMAFTVCGSPLYMAPEILQCQSYDRKCDLWSAGVVLFEMLCGTPLFLAHSEADLLRQVRSFRGPKFHQELQVQESFRNLLTRVLVIDPRNRIDYDEFISASHRLVLDHLSTSANNGCSCLPNDQTNCTPIPTHNVNSSVELLTLTPSLNLVDDFLAEFEACSLPTNALPISNTKGLLASKVQQCNSESSFSKGSCPSSNPHTDSQRNNVTHDDGQTASSDVAPQNFETKLQDSKNGESRLAILARSRCMLCLGILLCIMFFRWEKNLLSLICVRSPWRIAEIHRVNGFSASYLGLFHSSSFMVRPKDFKAEEKDTDAEAIGIALNSDFAPYSFLGWDSCLIDDEFIQQCSIDDIEHMKLEHDLLLPSMYTVSVLQDDKSQDAMALSPSSSSLGPITMMKDDARNRMEVPTSLLSVSCETIPSEFSRILRVLEFLFLCVSVILLFFYVRESVFILHPPYQVVAKVNVILPEKSLSDRSILTYENQTKWSLEKFVQKELGLGKRVKVEKS